MPRKPKQTPPTLWSKPISPEAALPPAPLIISDGVLFRAFSPEGIVALELGVEILRSGPSGPVVEIAPTARLRLTMRGFQSLLGAMLEIQRQIAESQQKAAEAVQGRPTTH